MKRKKIFLLLFGVLVALPCAQIIGQDTLHIEELGVYVRTEETPPPIPIPSDSTFIVDDGVKGVQGYENNYTQGWAHGTNNAPWHGGTLSYIGATNGAVTMRFNGKRIEWYTEKGPTHGIAAVSIDGGAETNIDLYASAFKQQVKVWESATLTQAVHTIKLRCTGTKNTSATNVYLITDFFKVVSPGIVPDIEPPDPGPNPPNADVVVQPGQDIKAVVERATSGQTVGLVQGTYTATLFNVPLGVNLVGAGKDKTIINFVGSMAQQSETGMIQLKGASTFAVSVWTVSGAALLLLLLLYLVNKYGPWILKTKRLISIIIVVIVVGLIIYILLFPQPTQRAAGNQTISGLTINGKFLCNGGIIVDGRDNVKILDVKVQETTYFGAWLKNTTGSEFANNDLLNSSWASVGWVTGELDVFNITNCLVHHNFIKTTRNDKGYGIKALWPDGTVKNSKFYSNRFQLMHFSLWNNGSAPNIDIELHDTYYNGIEIYDNDFSVMGLSLAGHKPSTGGRTIVRNNRFTWSSTAAIEVVCNNLTIESNTFSGSPMLTANFVANGKYTDIIVNNNDFNSDGTNPGWGALHLIGADGMNMTITNNRYNNTRGYQLVKHMGNPANSVIVESGNVIK